MPQRKHDRQNWIAERILNSILIGKLGPGERLGEQEVADLCGVSRTLVREALMQLRARGFIEVRSRMGWYVVEPTFEDACQTYAARRVIEPGMVRDALPLGPEAIQRLNEHVVDEGRAIRVEDVAARGWLLADFHVCLAEVLGNRLLTRMVVELSARTALVAALYQSKEGALISNHDHQGIVAALARGDHPLAERLMCAHIDRLTGRLDKTLADAASARDRLRWALGAE